MHVFSEIAKTVMVVSKGDVLYRSSNRINYDPNDYQKAKLRE